LCQRGKKKEKKTWRVRAASCGYEIDRFPYPLPVPSPPPDATRGGRHGLQCDSALYQRQTIFRKNGFKKKKKKLFGLQTEDLLVSSHKV